MTANLTPQYLSAEERYKAASSTEDKLAALKEMIALLPKHKGTEKMQANLKKRLSKLNDQAQKAQAKSSGSASPYEHIDREGAGQIVLVGLPNSGKSSLINAITNAEADVAEFPFSSLKPTVGMVTFENAPLQLIDLPPISEEYTEPWVYNLIRNADRVCVLIDLSTNDPEEAWLETIALLEGAKLQLVGGKHGEAFAPSTGTQKTLVVGTKSDMAEPTMVDRFENLFVEDFNFIMVNEIEGLDELKKALFDSLDVIRIYSKEPGKPADQSQPTILKKGTTTMGFAQSIHKDIAKNLKYANVWGSAQHDGQRVPHDHELQDGDVVEIHT